MGELPWIAAADEVAHADNLVIEEAARRARPGTPGIEAEEAG
jgi:hypothetical protein